VFQAYVRHCNGHRLLGHHVTDADIEARIRRVPEFDVTTPSIARVYDYWLGGCFL
jgi:hypothetical protein